MREGAQYGEGVAGGELRENHHEVPKAQPPAPTYDGQRDGYKLEEGGAHVPDVEHGPNAKVSGAGTASAGLPGSAADPSHHG